MAGVRAGYGLTLGNTTIEVINSLSANLSDNALPRWDDANLQFLDSGLTRDPTTGALTTTADIMTTGRIQSGVATFGLGQAHDITSAAENVTFTNRVTNTVFHPTWQTTGIDGNWNSVQRTPVGDFVTNHPFQPIDTENITNPNFMFTSLAIDHRLYAVNIEPVNTVSNVRVLVQQNNGIEFVDYWRSQPFDLIADTQQNIVIRPFIDLFASTQYRLMTIADSDVILKGDTNGLPRLLINYWQWEDVPLATRPYVGDYRLDGTVGISSDITITSANVAQYQNKLWLITGAGTQNVTVNDDLELTFFAVYTVGSSTNLLIRATPSGSFRIDNEFDKRYTQNFGVIFARVAANDFRPLSTNVGDAEDDFVDSLSFTANVLTAGRNRLTDLTATMPAATTSAAGAMSNTDKTKLDGIATGAEVNVQSNWNEASPTADSFIQNKPTIPTVPTIPDEFTDLTDTPATITALQYLRANSAGNALEFINPLVIDGTVEITADVTITSANIGTYNRRLWLITTGSHTVTINAGSGLTIFAIYVRRVGDTGTITPQASSNVRINNTTDSTVIEERQSATFFSITTDRFQEIANNFRPANFVNLGDTPAAITANQFLRGNSGGTALEFVTAPTGGASTFLALTDTPAAFTASQFLRVNAAGNAIEFGGSLGAASTNWDHQTLPSGRLPSNNRRWYTYTGTGNITRQMPLESGIVSGWHSFIGNDSTTGTITLTGDFRGSLTSIALLPQQGCEMSYNGSIFLEGANRDLITVSSFPDWVGNPLRHDTSYTGFAANSNGLNIDVTGSMAALNALLNRNVRVSTRSDNDFLFDLPILSSSNFNLVPIGSGFGVFANGPQETLIRPRSNDSLTRGTLSHNFSNGVRLFPGAGVTFVRSGTDTWNVTIQSGTITGGS